MVETTHIRPIGFIVKILGWFDNFLFEQVSLYICRLTTACVARRCEYDGGLQDRLMERYKEKFGEQINGHDDYEMRQNYE